MIDYQALLLDPLYATLGVPAVVTLADATTSFEGLTVIDKTSGLQFGSTEAKVDTVEPACCIRAKQWSALGRTTADFEGATIEFNGSRWDIVAYPKRPVPSGARQGEILLILSNETVVEDDSPSSDSSS
jgi:hypothetical protein